MKNKDFSDGVCESCGNTGLAGEKCLVCGGTLSVIQPDDSTRNSFEGDQDESKEPESYPLDMDIDQDDSKDQDTYPLDEVDKQIEEKNSIDETI